LKRQIQDVARWPPDRRRTALPKGFLLLSCPDPGPGPGICALQAAAGRSPARTRVRHLPAVPVAVLCGCTIVPIVRITSLTCGA